MSITQPGSGTITHAGSDEPGAIAGTAGPGLVPAGFQERCIELPAGRVNYVESGEGETLLLLHGGYGSWQHWQANLDALSRRFHVIGMDMPGFGESDALEGALTIEVLSQAVADAACSIIRNKKGANAQPRCSILAFSFGTTVAVEMARMHPERVAAMLLLSPPAIMPVPKELLDIQSRAAESARREGFMAGVRVTAHEAMLWDHALIDETVLEIIARGVRRCRVKSREISRAMSMLPIMEKLAMPLRVLYGEHDPFYRSRIDEFLRRTRDAVGLQGADLVRDCSHWIQYEKPEVVLKEAHALFGH